MDAEKLKGLAVVSIADGARLGRIKDVYVDTKDLRVVSFRVSGEGPDVMLALDDVKSVGPDAVTVENSRVTQVINKGDPVASSPGLDQMKALKAVDEAGTFLGTVKTIDVDAATGHIQSIEVQKGGVLGLGGTATTIVAARLRSIGRDIITVATGEGTPTNVGVAPGAPASPTTGIGAGGDTVPNAGGDPPAPGAGPAGS